MRRARAIGFVTLLAVYGGITYGCGKKDESPPKIDPGATDSGGKGGTGGTSSGASGAGAGGVGGAGAGGVAGGGGEAASSEAGDAPDGDAADGDAADGEGGSMCADGSFDFDGGCVGPCDMNGAQNGYETDQDCGGPGCQGCATGKHCLADADCASLHCDTTDEKCLQESCTDAIKNGDETDKDCGGTICSPCSDGKRCVQDTDCGSKICSGTPAVCQVATCTDGITNGYETDLDCGGADCSACTRGQKCAQSSDCVTQNCVATQCQCPSGMVIAPIRLGGTFCVDQYEVTYAQYAVFRASPSKPQQPPECAWNTNEGPAIWPAKPSSVYPAGDQNYPVVGPDWCDAWEYCAWAGKRLCGKIGGGAVPYGSYTDHDTSQWQTVCSAQGGNPFPYGLGYVGATCNGDDYNWNFPDGGAPGEQYLPGVRYSPFPDPNTCQGGEVGVYDMSGNLGEWEDSCDATSGAADNCRVRGGNYSDTAETDLACAADRSHPRNTRNDYIGIRCCQD